jgi:Glyoxalase-like domain
MAVHLDHILWGAPDLDEGARFFERLSGIAPAPGGSHAGFGTRNRLLSLGEGLFFEIIAPDPAQKLEGTRGAKLAALRNPGLIAFSVRADDIGALARTAAAANIPARGPVAMGRTRSDGVRLDWEILYFGGEADSDAIPFAIDWKNSPHPSRSTPGGLTLKRFVALHPERKRLAAIYEALGIPVAVERADRAGYSATLATPRGDLVLTAA